MKLEFDQVAYKLRWDIEHFRNLRLDWNEDIFIQKYDNYRSYEFYQTESFTSPIPIIYEGYLDVVRFIDYPYPNNMWNIMSERMLKTLLSIKDFPHQIIPVEIRTVDAVNLPIQAEKPLKNYCAVQLTTHLDIFDYEKSKYERDEDEPDRLDVSEYVFKVPPEGLPPIFRITADNYRTFISAEARQALKNAGITGTRYISLKGFHREEERDWVDNPIVLPDKIFNEL